MTPSDEHRLWEYLDGELAEHEMEVFRRRLEGEAELRGAYERLSGFDGLAKEVYPRQVFRVPVVNVPKRRRWRGWAAAAAAVLVVAGAVWGAVEFGGTPGSGLGEPYVADGPIAADGRDAKPRGAENVEAVETLGAQLRCGGHRGLALGCNCRNSGKCQRGDDTGGAGRDAFDVGRSSRARPKRRAGAIRASSGGLVAGGCRGVRERVLPDAASLGRGDRGSSD